MRTEARAYTATRGCGPLTRAAEKFQRNATPILFSGGPIPFEDDKGPRPAPSPFHSLNRGGVAGGGGRHAQGDPQTERERGTNQLEQVQRIGRDSGRRRRSHCKRQRGRVQSSEPTREHFWKVFDDVCACLHVTQREKKGKDKRKEKEAVLWRRAVQRRHRPEHKK